MSEGMKKNPKKKKQKTIQANSEGGADTTTLPIEQNFKIQVLTKTSAPEGTEKSQDTEERGETLDCTSF